MTRRKEKLERTCHFKHPGLNDGRRLREEGPARSVVVKMYSDGRSCVDREREGASFGAYVMSGKASKTRFTGRGTPNQSRACLEADADAPEGSGLAADVVEGSGLAFDVVVGWRACAEGPLALALLGSVSSSGRCMLLQSLMYSTPNAATATVMLYGAVEVR